MKCILPYSRCVYSLTNGGCGGVDRPDNKNAKCYRLSGKKKMLKQTKIDSIIVLYEPLEVNIEVCSGLVVPIMYIRVGKLKIATLKHYRVKGGSWCLIDTKPPLSMGKDEVDAVEATLKYLGYK